jgi:hypothetical protein
MEIVGEARQRMRIADEVLESSFGDWINRQIVVFAKHLACKMFAIDQNSTLNHGKVPLNVSGRGFALKALQYQG